MIKAYTHMKCHKIYQFLHLIHDIKMKQILNEVLMKGPVQEDLTTVNIYAPNM